MVFFSLIKRVLNYVFVIWNLSRQEKRKTNTSNTSQQMSPLQMFTCYSALKQEKCVHPVALNLPSLPPSKEIRENPTLYSLTSLILGSYDVTNSTLLS